MKKIILLVFVMFMITNIGLLQAQDEDYFYGDDNNTKIVRSPKLYLGLGGGLFYRTGLIGGIIEYRIVPKTYVTMSGGLGGWGLKGAIGGRYIFNDTKGFGISSSYYIATGGSNLQLHNTTSSSSYNVTSVDLKPAHGINLSLAYHLSVSPQFRIGLEIGYTYQINKNAYIVRTTLQPDDMNVMTLKMMQPQGIGVGMFFVFGL